MAYRQNSPHHGEYPTMSWRRMIGPGFPDAGVDERASWGNSNLTTPSRKRSSWVSFGILRSILLGKVKMIRISWYFLFTAYWLELGSGLGGWARFTCAASWGHFILQGFLDGRNARRGRQRRAHLPTSDIWPFYGDDIGICELIVDRIPPIFLADVDD